MAPNMFFLLLVLLLSEGNCLKCYKCTTHKDLNSACEDLSKGKETVTTEECSEGEVCTIFTTKSPGTGNTVISRSCGPKDTCDNLHAKETDYSKLEDCRTCNTNLCDSGSIFGASVMTLLVSLVFVNYFY